MSNVIKTFWDLMKGSKKSSTKKKTAAGSSNSKSTTDSSWAVTNPTYSGCDMVAMINITTNTGKTISTVLGEIMTISYSIHQEKAPVRIVSNINALDWVMGPRTIAGSLVFAVFNKHWIYNIYEQVEKEAPMKNEIFIPDELPPFDIICSFASELGFESYLVLYGVRIINEGQVVASINDIYPENTYQFVCSSISLLKDSSEPNTTKSKKGASVISSSSSSETDSSKSSKNTIKPIAAK